MGLGNPGPRYDDTRHNVGWWMVDRLAYDWNFGSFVGTASALVARGSVAHHEVELRKPTLFMNRSGLALTDLAAEAEEGRFALADDLLVVVDDAALDVGRVRFRPSGGAGGHNGLRSVAGILGTEVYPRLRIGVGRCPDGVDLADWVLAPMDAEDEDEVVGLLPGLTEAVKLWLDEGTEAAMNRFNR